MLKSNKHPDIIHCHDWQTGLVPVLLYEMYKQAGMTHPRVCYTLHNLQHQGITGEHILRATGLNRHAYFFHQDRLQDNFNHSRHQPDEGRASSIRISSRRSRPITRGRS